MKILLQKSENRFLGQHLFFENSRKIQFCKSIYSKFWKILELETKILIYFSTPRNPNITFLDRSQNLQKSMDIHKETMDIHKETMSIPDWNLVVDRLAERTTDLETG